MIPGNKGEQSDYLPWNITPTPDGSITVFGLTLGKSTLRETENRVQEHAEVSLFKQNDGQKKLEAYFDTTAVAGFRAKMVVEIMISDEMIEQYFNRGIRIAKTGGDKHKVTLNAQDLAEVYNTPIASLTYLPRMNLTPELIEKRFGVPAQKIEEREGVVHWLYPEKGLDVLFSEEEKDVLQYLPPRDFQRLMKPLFEGKSIAPEL